MLATTKASKYTLRSSSDGGSRSDSNGDRESGSGGGSSVSDRESGGSEMKMQKPLVKVSPAVREGGEQVGEKEEESKKQGGCVPFMHILKSIFRGRHGRGGEGERK